MAKTPKTAAPVQAPVVLTLEQRIDAAILSDGSFDAQVHGLAVETLTHAATHGDISLFARLIGDVTTAGGVTFGKGVRSRRLALIEWAAEFSPIRINGDGKIGQLPNTAKAYKPYNVELAEAHPFYTGKAEEQRRTTNKPFDVAVMAGRIGSFVKAIDKAVENDMLNDDETALRQLAVDVNTYFATRAAELGLSSDAAKARRTQAAA